MIFLRLPLFAAHADAITPMMLLMLRHAAADLPATSAIALLAVSYAIIDAITAVTPLRRYATLHHGDIAAVVFQSLALLNAVIIFAIVLRCYADDAGADDATPLR